MMETTICVLGYSNWFIKEDNKKGNTLHYISNSPETNPNKHGFMPIKKTVTDEVVGKLLGQKFPLICNMKFDLVTKGNSMDINIVSLDPISPVEM